MKHISYWLDTAPVGVDYTATTLPDRVDVAVVGGGFTGLSSAIPGSSRSVTPATRPATRSAAERARGAPR